MIKTKCIFLIISIIATFSQCNAKIIIKENTTVNDINLDENLFFLMDSTNSYTLKQVLSPEFSHKFTQAEKSTFFHKKNIPTQWYKIPLQNKTQEVQSIILQINSALIEKINLFSSFDSVFYTGGNSYPYYQRQIESNVFLYELRILPKKEGVICIKIEKQETPLFLPFKIIDKKTYYKKLYYQTIFDAAIYTLASFLIISLLILYRKKEKYFLYFLGLILSLVFYALYRDTLLFKTLIPDYPILNEKIGHSLIYLTLFFTLSFQIEYLSTKLKNSLRKIAKFIIILLSISFLLSFFSYSQTFNFWIQIIFLIFILLFSIYSLTLAKKLKKEDYPFFVSILIVLNTYLFFNIIFHFDIKTFDIGILTIQTEKIVLLFSTFTVAYLFLFSFKTWQRKISGMNENLEILVKERTLQLKTQQEELKSQQEELLIQKEVLQIQREEMRAQKELLLIKNKELQKLSLIASKTDNLIYIFKPNGELDWFNSSFDFVVGMSYETYKHSPPINIIDISLNKNIKHVLQTCLREKVMTAYESIYHSPENIEMWFHTTLTPILNEDDQVTLFIAIDTNITKQKQYETMLNEQKQDAEKQKQIAIKHKEEAEEQQKEMTDSIRYAKRIQSAIIPKVRQIQRDFPDSFILFLPKDIVSGDFYWYHRIGDKYFIAAVDCTGHGVPGAFMSIIGNYLLNSIIIHNNIEDPAEILKHLNRKIKIALQADQRSENSDGMDISIAVIDKKENTLNYAAALRPMFLFSNNDFIEAKGDKIPITSSISDIVLSSFKTQHYTFNPGDMFYLFSDGIIDQFGGDKDKKFLTKRFKQLLFNIKDMPMKQQKEHIKKAFDDWKGINKQVDDVLVMGVKY